MQITVTGDELRLIRRALVHESERVGAREVRVTDLLAATAELDDLLDRLPEPVDHIDLGVDDPNEIIVLREPTPTLPGVVGTRRDLHRYSDGQDRIREARYEAQNGGL